MDIDFLRTGRTRHKRQQKNRNGDQKPYTHEKVLGCLLYPFYFLVSMVWLAWFLGQLGCRNVRDYLSGRWCVLFIECAPEQVPAVRFSLKTILELPYDEFRHLEDRVPGPFLRGSREALTWLADGLQKANVPCRVRRVHPDKLTNLAVFHYPLAYELSVADAYSDSKEINSVTVRYLE